MMPLRALVAATALAAVSAAAFPSLSVPNSSRTVVEYFSPATGHYVLISDPEEIAKVDSGAAGRWLRTGHAFGARASTASQACAVSTRPRRTRISTPRIRPSASR